eukprot:scaffold112564_cov32-Tisochrysis_lutea.AAC.2
MHACVCMLGLVVVDVLISSQENHGGNGRCPEWASKVYAECEQCALGGAKARLVSGRVAEIWRL